MNAPKLNVKSGDTVVVISGKDKGKQGKIQKAFPSTGKIIVEGVAMVKKHQKPRGQGMPGGIVDNERVSNLLIDELRAAKIGRITLDLPLALRRAQSQAAQAGKQEPAADEAASDTSQNAAKEETPDA